MKKDVWCLAYEGMAAHVCGSRSGHLFMQRLATAWRNPLPKPEDAKLLSVVIWKLIILKSYTTTKKPLKITWGSNSNGILNSCHQIIGPQKSAETTEPNFNLYISYTIAVGKYRLLVCSKDRLARAIHLMSNIIYWVRHFSSILPWNRY